MESTEDLSSSSLSLAGSDTSVQKLRGTLGDLGVHNGCARSHSTDSGFVTESDSTSHDSAEAVLSAEDVNMSTIPECMCGAGGNENGTNETSGTNQDVSNGKTDIESFKQCPCCGKNIPGSAKLQHKTIPNSEQPSHRKLHRLTEDVSRERSHSEPLNPRKLNLTLNVTPLNIRDEDSKTNSEHNINDNNSSDSMESKTPPNSNVAPPSSKQSWSSWLLRLFESKLFDMTIAITYLYNSKEPGVQTYIGKQLFSL